MCPSSLVWAVPPVELSLDNDEVHVWHASLELEDQAVAPLEQVLSEDERARARRFYFARDRKHFTVARGLCRIILGRYLSKDPHMLQFCYGQYGKPSLTHESGGALLSFNVSHSHGRALYAVARQKAVGVDIEFMRQDVEYEELAKHSFSPAEVRMLYTVPLSLRRDAFFACWTRKEAYIKARGMGLSLDLNLFDVSLVPGEPAALLETREADQHAADWSMCNLLCENGYAGALAIQSTNYRLSCYLCNLL